MGEPEIYLGACCPEHSLSGAALEERHRSSQVKGKLLELSNHHTASRVLQFCIKYGGEAERKTMMEEVRGQGGWRSPRAEAQSHA